MEEMVKTIKTNMGEIPVEDYLDIMAMQYGFDSYKEMREEGYWLDEEKYLTGGC